MTIDIINKMENDLRILRAFVEKNPGILDASPTLYIRNNHPPQIWWWSSHGADARKIAIPLREQAKWTRHYSSGAFDWIGNVDGVELFIYRAEELPEAPQSDTPVVLELTPEEADQAAGFGKTEGEKMREQLDRAHDMLVENLTKTTVPDAAVIEPQDLQEPVAQN